jgi:hypothetical protein
MQRGLLRCSFVAACFFFASLSLTAQEVVHALAGTVTTIDPTAKTITVKAEDGSVGLFKEMTDPNTPIDFNAKFRRDATAADEFNENGVRVIVYYIGNGDIRTAVALRSLGAGPFTVTNGEVVSFEKGKHFFSVINSSGTVESFKITTDTVVEGPLGAQEGSTFRPANGDRVRVTAAIENGTLAALFINTMVAN